MTTRRPYRSDASDAQWALVEPILSAWRAERDARDPVRDRPRTDLREAWNAILYVNRTGCGWEYLPHDLPNWSTVVSYFYAWRDAGLFEQINALLVRRERIRIGRNPEPSAGVIDTQSVKTAGTVPAREQGPDPGKKIVGRKRGITDTLGLILAVTVSAASLSDNIHGNALLDQVHRDHSGISIVWVDQGFRKQVADHGADLGIRVVTVPTPEGAGPGFHVVKRRWVVERSLGTLMFARRLVRDYEKQSSSSKAMIYTAQIAMLTRRLTGQTTPTWRGC
jgi:transposase